MFASVLLGDEINRAPAKTQAALLEAMQERAVTVDGRRHELPRPFFVLATMNPIEHEGTYPLPEAQLDRFLLRIEMVPPPREAELELYRRAVAGSLAGWRDEGTELEPAVTAAEAAALRTASGSVHVAPELLGYLLALTEGVRRSAHVELGPSPRGALSLLEAARAWALLRERDYLLPDDLKRMLVPCWGHRLLLVAEAELEGAPRAACSTRWRPRWTCRGGMSPLLPAVATPPAPVRALRDSGRAALPPARSGGAAARRHPG